MQIVESGQQIAGDGKRLILAHLVGFLLSPLAIVLQLGLGAHVEVIVRVAFGPGRLQLIQERDRSRGVVSALANGACVRSVVFGSDPRRAVIWVFPPLMLSALGFTSGRVFFLRRGEIVLELVEK